MTLIDDLPPVDLPRAARRTLRDLAGAGATDPSTGLPTWRGLHARLEAGRADAPVCGAVIYIDRALQTTRTAFADDLVLRRLAEEVRRALPRGSEMARLDADELVLVIPGHAAGLVDPVAVVRDASTRLAADTQLGIHATDILCCPLAPTTTLGLLGQVRRVQSQLLTRVPDERPEPEVVGPSDSQIGQALERSEFRLAYQPVLDSTGAVVAVEALIRWESPEDGLLLPGAFLPAIERHGMDLDVGEWVLRQAMDDAARWDQLELGGVPVVVNVSAAQLSSDGLCDLVAATMFNSGAPGIVLEIAPRPDEIDLHGLVHTFQDLRAAGAHLSLDRVDRSAVSAGLLTVLPYVDTVKLDRSVVADLHGGGRATAAALRILADRAGVHLGATGVETADQLSALRGLGVDYVQGYRFCPPVRAGDLPGRANPLARDAAQF